MADKEIEIMPESRDGKVTPPHAPGVDVFDREWRDERWGERTLSVAAQTNTDEEKDMTTRQAIQNYKSAIFWSLAISTAVIMEGFDTNLLGNFWAYPSFQYKYGTFVGKSKYTKTGYQIPAKWQAAVGQAPGIGAFIGTLLNGYLVAIYGQRKVLIGALLMLSACLFITFFAPSLEVLLVGELMCGFPWGVFATSAPAYSSEILPMQLRVYFTSYTNMCFIIGQLISAGVLRGLSTRTDQWGYRIPFALQWFWPLILIPTIYLAPESPWYLVRRERFDEAEHSIRRLQSSTADIDPKKTLATIVYTNNLEEQLSVGTSYWDCFKGFELRRTEIACVAFAGQLVCGLCFAYASTFFFEQVGLDSGTTYSLALGANALALVGTLCSWFLIMPYFGRRTIYLCGMAAMAAVLIIIGILNIKTSNERVALTQAVLTLVWTFIFQLSVGQLGWAIPAEIGSTRLRQKTVCLARNAFYLVGVVGGTLEPYFISPQAWNLKGYTGFIWGGCAVLVFIWGYFRLPETKDRTYHELDMLFAKKVSARKFKTTEVDAFDEEEADRLARHYSTINRPSIIPSLTDALARSGKDEASAAQRRASVAPGIRKPSIAFATTEYLEKANKHDA